MSLMAAFKRARRARTSGLVEGDSAIVGRGRDTRRFLTDAAEVDTTAGAAAAATSAENARTGPLSALLLTAGLAAAADSAREALTNRCIIAAREWGCTSTATREGSSNWSEGTKCTGERLHSALRAPPRLGCAPPALPLCRGLFAAVRCVLSPVRCDGGRECAPSVGAAADGTRSLCVLRALRLNVDAASDGSIISAQTGAEERQADATEKPDEGMLPACRAGASARHKSTPRPP